MVGIDSKQAVMMRMSIGHLEMLPHDRAPSVLSRCRSYIFARCQTRDIVYASVA